MIDDDYQIADGADAPEEGVVYILGERAEFFAERATWCHGRRVLVEFRVHREKYSRRRGRKTRHLFVKVLDRGRVNGGHMITTWDGRRAS